MFMTGTDVRKEQLVLEEMIKVEPLYWLALSFLDSGLLPFTFSEVLTRLLKSLLVTCDLYNQGFLTRHSQQRPDSWLILAW